MSDYMYPSEYAERRGIEWQHAFTLMLLTWLKQECDVLLGIIRDGETEPSEFRPFTQGFTNTDGNRDPEGEYKYCFAAVRKPGLIEMLDFWLITKPELAPAGSSDTGE